MKVKNRVFAIFALIFNVLILGATGYGLYLSFSSTPDPLSVLRYFTIDSNALLCVAALMMIPNNIIKIAKPEKPYVPFFKNLKFVAVVSTTITLVTAYAFLGPTGMFGTYVQATLGALDINIMLKSEIFFLHTFAPALGILSEIFDKDVKAKYKLVTYGFIPLAIYTVPYLVFAVVPGLKATYGGDWYGFLSFNLLSNEIANTAVLALIAVLGEFIIALLFGTIIWALTLIGANSKDNRERVTYSYVGSKDEPKKEEVQPEPIPVEEVKEEPTEEVASEESAEDVAAEEPEQVQEESVSEEAPVEEEQPTEEDQVQEEPTSEETPAEEEPVDEQPVEKEEVEPEETPEETPVEQPAEVQPEESKTEEKPQEEKKVWPFQKKKEKKGFAKKSEESKKEEPKEEKEQKPAKKKSSPAKKPAAKKAAPAKKEPAKKAEPKKEAKETTNKKSTNKGGTKVAVAKKEAAPAKKPAAKKEEPAKFNGKARVYHISQHENGYKVKLAGGEKAIKTFKTQKEAIAYAKELVKTQGGTYLIHSLDGSIRKG